MPARMQAGKRSVLIADHHRTTNHKRDNTLFLQALLNVDEPLVCTTPKGQRKVTLVEFKWAIYEHIGDLKKRHGERIGQQGFVEISRIDPELLLWEQLFEEGADGEHEEDVVERLAAGDRQANDVRVGQDMEELRDNPFRTGLTPIKRPGRRVVASLAMMRTALNEKRHPKADAVVDVIGLDAGDVLRITVVHCDASPAFPLPAACPC